MTYDEILQDNITSITYFKIPEGHPIKKYDATTSPYGSNDFHDRLVFIGELIPSELADENRERGAVYWRVRYAGESRTRHSILKET